LSVCGSFSRCAKGLSIPSGAHFSTIASPSRKISTIGVIGAGQMGIGIAQVASQIGKLNVLLLDSDAQKLSSSIKSMDSQLQKKIAKGKMTEEERKDTLSRIQTTTSMSEFAKTDFVVEAVSENLSLKEKIFKQLTEITPPTTILATNTSSISITKIGSVTNRPDKVIGMHFMNPVPVMQLVEVIPSLATSEATLNTTLDLAKSFGKTTTTSKDMPGFIANRLLMPYINEACQAMLEGIGSREDIDTTMKLGCNMPMGPLTLADFIGLDTCLAIMRVLHEELGEDKYRPSPLLVKYVEAGWFGVKSKHGFYTY